MVVTERRKEGWHRWKGGSRSLFTIAGVVLPRRHPRFARDLTTAEPMKVIFTQQQGSASKRRSSELECSDPRSTGLSHHRPRKEPGSIWLRATEHVFMPLNDSSADLDPDASMTATPYQLMVHQTRKDGHVP